jgi:hypothetical protein
MLSCQEIVAASDQNEKKHFRDNTFRFYILYWHSIVIIKLVLGILTRIIPPLLVAGGRVYYAGDWALQRVTWHSYTGI